MCYIRGISHVEWVEEVSENLFMPNFHDERHLETQRVVFKDVVCSLDFKNSFKEKLKEYLNMQRSSN